MYIQGFHVGVGCVGREEVAEALILIFVDVTLKSTNFTDVRAFL